jgi:hypothetical protein
MNYLYGDSTTSHLKSNFLEFLRDAIDFSVFVLQADAKMKLGRKQIAVLTEQSETELARLDRYITSVQRAVQTGEKGEPDSPTANCGNRLASLIADAHRQSIEAIRRALANEVARIEAEEAAGRDACVRALGTLLAPHEPPDGSTITRLGLLDSGRYDATLDGKAEPSLAWTLEVGIPDGHAWATPMRVDRLVQHLEIRAPQLGGWITKEVRIRPQKIERHVLTEIVDRGAVLAFQLRTEPTSMLGFDFDVDAEKGAVIKAVRVGAADDASVGQFELLAEDVVLVVDLAKKLRASMAGLERRPNITATFDGTDFQALPSYIDFVEPLVAVMAPIVREIAVRSLTPNELILRRQLTNDRREEIFVAKTTLREKIGVLPPDLRGLFTPLGLDLPEPTRAKAKAPVPADEPPPVRSELPPSAPPPPLASSPPAPALRPSRVPSPTIRSFPPAAPVPEEAPASGRTLQPPDAAPPQANPPVDDAPQIEVVEEVEMNSDAFIEVVPETPRAAMKSEGGRNEALVASLKKILTLSKNGRAVEAYQEYAHLFSSSAFGSYRPEDQRQALKLMVLASSHPPDKDAVANAHRAALTRIKALVDATHEAADQELLGVTHLYLGDEKAATAAFQAGLDLERAKNPQSELVATLMRRVSQL